MSENARNGNASSSSKKRKRIVATYSRSYVKRFKAVQGGNAADVVVASPDRVGKENTSSGHVVDSNISKLYEGIKISQYSAPFSEIKSTLGDSEPIIVQKEDSASGHVKVMPSDETDGNSNICGACGSPGTLSCTKKRFQFGLHSIVDGIESVWDVKEAEGMQNYKQYFVKYKNLAHVHNRWVLEDDINVMPGGPDALSLFNKRNHTEKVKQSSFKKLQRLPDGCHPDFDNDHLCSINLLREFWYKSRGAVLVDDKSGVAGGNSMGGILEGVVCDRFGRESYERVESGAPLARKQAAVNMFNDKTKGRFVFLIESRACLPSIKLLSVDVVIIYNSDCNPLNDLKAIQRIKIESQKYPGIFRLYTPFTMEEKQLVLAKHGVLIGNYKDMPHSLGYSLDNAKLKAEQFFEYYLNNHLVLPDPVDILRAFNIALCWHAASHLNYKVDRRESVALAEKGFNCEYNKALVGLIYKKLRTLKKKVPNRAGEASIKGQPVSVEDTQLSWQEKSTYLENDHMFQNKEIDLHGNFTDGAPQEVSSVAEQMMSEGQEPVKETHKECHMLNDEPPNMIMEKSIDLVENVFSIRKNNILCKQQLEISGLVTHWQNNVIRLKEVYSLVLEHIHRSHIDEMTRSEKIKLTAQWFSMLIYAFLEHMKLQHGKLEGLQSDTWSSECQLKEKLHQVAKSGQLDRDFDRHIALPDSNFVMEEFIHFEEQNDEYRIAESSVSDCQQSSNDTVSMEITLVRSEALSEPISIHAMENEPVETSAGSGGGPALEAVDFQENNIHCSSDGISVQRAGCSSSTIPANDDSTGQCHSPAVSGFLSRNAMLGRLKTPVAEQPFEFSSAAQTTASPAISSSAIRPPGSCVRPSFVALPPSSSSSSWNAQLPGNLYGTASSPSVPAPVPYGSYGPAGAQSRAVQPLSALASNLYRTMPPAPPPHLPHGSYGSAAAQLRAPSSHLQQLRVPSQYAMHTDQQQRRAATAAVPLLGQSVRGSYASTVPQGGTIRNSMDPSSAHQASSSRPPRRASLLPPRRHPESMLSLQPSTSNPIFMRADQSSSYPSMALGGTGTAGPQNAAPGSQQHGGAQIAGINHNQPGSEPASLNAYLKARLRLVSGSSPAGVASREVVCLSDDEP
ncbi:hypothetical protein ACQ4PT_013771 [Festuca glaucescens]